MPQPITMTAVAFSFEDENRFRFHITNNNHPDACRTLVISEVDLMKRIKGMLRDELNRDENISIISIKEGLIEGLKNA